ncbi:hypothetical protein MASR2M78_03690 [Treponema sp.]
MKTVTDRCLSRLDDHGWIDMKFDPVDGTERDASQENYRKDRVYGWIQAGLGISDGSYPLDWRTHRAA